MNSFENFVPKRLFRDFRQFSAENRRFWPYVGALFICVALYSLNRSKDEAVHVYKSETTPDFKDARILGSQGDSIYEGKERLLLKVLLELKETQKTLQAKVEELEKGKSGGAVPNNPTINNNSQATPMPELYGPTPVPSSSPVSTASVDPKAILAKEPIKVGPPPENLSVTTVLPSRHHRSIEYGQGPREHGGSSIISFPVKDMLTEQSEGIVLPAGSYVKAKLMTGVEAPEGRTYPALLQLDYAYIVPNHHKLDLSGCFMIAKSQGDLSTERVQMQATKISCVSKAGRMFEREVNGFIADEKDNSFAVIGSVNSKQDRVAAMGFLSSIVAGVGKAIQTAQTTQQLTPLGGAQSTLTGDKMSYIGAGGASDAASMVTQWCAPCRRCV